MKEFPRYALISVLVSKANLIPKVQERLLSGYSGLVFPILGVE
jgi:hypothetical protein